MEKIQQNKDCSIDSIFKTPLRNPVEDKRTIKLTLKSIQKNKELFQLIKNDLVPSWNLLTSIN
jgi:hypothetical protein